MIGKMNKLRERIIGRKIGWKVSSAPGNPIVIHSIDEIGYYDDAPLREDISGGIALDLEMLQKLKNEINVMIAMKKIIDNEGKVPEIQIEEKGDKIRLYQEGIDGLIITPYQLLKLKEKFNPTIEELKEKMFMPDGKTPRCARCGKAMVQISKHEWMLNCECIKKYPKLKNLRLSIG